MTLAELAASWRNYPHPYPPEHENVNWAHDEGLATAADELEDWAKTHGRFVPPEVLVSIGIVLGRFQEGDTTRRDSDDKHINQIERWLDT